MSTSLAAKRTGLLLPICLAGAVFLVYVWDRVVIPTELVELRKVFDLGLPSAGLLASVFTIGLTITAILAGFVVLAFGTRMSLAVGALIFSLCTGYTAFGFGFGDLLVARIGTGIGEGIYDIAFLSFLAGVTVRYRAASVGIAASLFGIGLFSGPLIVSGLLTHSGDWRTAFYVLAAIGIVGAALIASTLRDEHFDQAKKRGAINLRRLSSTLSPRNIGVCIVMGVTGMCLYSYVSLFQTYLRVDHHMAVGTASWVASAFGLGSIVGGVPIGYVADVVGRRRFLPILMVVAGITGVVIFAVTPTPFVAGVLSFVLGTAVNGIVANSYALIQDQVEAENIPLATGLLTTVYNLIAAGSGYILPTLKNAFGWVEASVIIYAIPYAVALVLLFWLADRRTWERVATA